jgi:hypothetical protein
MTRGSTTWVGPLESERELLSTVSVPGTWKVFCGSTRERRRLSRRVSMVAVGAVPLEGKLAGRVKRVHRGSQWSWCASCTCWSHWHPRCLKPRRRRGRVWQARNIQQSKVEFESRKERNPVARVTRGRQGFSVDDKSSLKGSGSGGKCWL